MNSLLEALKLKSDRRFRLRLAVLLIVNDEYLIGIPEKASTPLTGFYINPESGRIEYRVSSNASLAYKAQIKESIKFRSIEAVR